MIMTTPRDDIAVLSERLRKRSEPSEYSTGDVLGEEAATQLDSLLKERDALQARVKELEERDRLKENRFAEWCSELEARALRAEQERDEAYERLKDHLDHLDGGLKLLLAAVKADDPKEEIIWRVEEEMVQAYRIRRLAGPEKEKS